MQAVSVKAEIDPMSVGPAYFIKKSEIEVLKKLQIGRGAQGLGGRIR